MKHKFFSRRAFTMIELIFVIVIIGIISKFGVEFLSEAYKSFIYSNVNNTLQSQSATAVEFVASRLQHRIKDSIIVRNSTGFVSLTNANKTHNVLEWVGADIDSFRGLSDNSLTDNLPNYSGIMDLDHPMADATHLVSPETDTSKINTLIDILSDGKSSINDSALYFIGSDSDINGYGWNGVAIADQTRSMHPVQTDANVSIFAPAGGSFSGIDVFEYYKLAWSAYAVVHTADNNLMLYYNYQPWKGEKYSDTGKNIKSAIIMQNVSTFRFMAIGSLVKIQICVKSDKLKEDYSICKEKTIY